MTAEVILEIEEKIRLDWSPEQISGKLEITISHERIYQHLQHSHKKRKKPYGSKDKRSQIRNRIRIGERPEIVA